jgi:hypothetical protein
LRQALPIDRAPVSISCPACGAPTRSTIGWIRICGGVFCQSCTELILLEGEWLASGYAAIEEAVRCLDEVTAELRRPMTAR